MDGGAGVHGISGSGVQMGAAAGWMAYSVGQPKLFAASLITMMLAGALVSIEALVKTGTGAENLPLI